jgi:AcrR family transcriptional regulator
MLLYDFGSKDELVAAVLAEVRRRETELFVEHVRTIEDVWRFIADARREPFLRLFFEVYVDAIGSGDAEPLVRDWLDYLRESWGFGQADATIAIALIRGLLLDLLATGDRQRTDSALRRFSRGR